MRTHIGVERTLMEDDADEAWCSKNWTPCTSLTKHMLFAIHNRYKETKPTHRTHIDNVPAVTQHATGPRYQSTSMVVVHLANAASASRRAKR